MRGDVRGQVRTARHLPRANFVSTLVRLLADTGEHPGYIETNHIGLAIAFPERKTARLHG
jgi:hypothetical protein